MVKQSLKAGFLVVAAAASIAIVNGCSCGGPTDQIGTSSEEVTSELTAREISRMMTFHVSLQQALGDVNGDGRVDRTDLELVRELISGRRATVPCEDAADLNYDGVIDDRDAALLQAVLDQGGLGALVLVPARNRCTRRATDLATRHGFAGDHVPVLFFRQLGTSRPATFRVLSGPGSIRREQAQLHWVDIDPAAAVGARIELEVTTHQQKYQFVIEVLERRGLARGMREPPTTEEPDSDSTQSDLAPSSPGPLGAADAGIDGGLDAGRDAGADAGLDAGTDAGLDAGTDGGLDGGMDGGSDAGRDGGTDGGMDGGRDGGDDCPQRGQGCDSLIVELIYEWYFGGVGNMSSRLGAIGCVTHVYDINANFKPKPERRFIPSPSGPVGFWNMTEAEFAAKLQQWKAWKAAEQAKLDAAIAAHIAQLAIGKEIGIGVVNAHGSQPDCPDCGAVSSVELEVGLNRNDDFIQPIYNGANRHVCAWLVFDSSCYSGGSVAAFNAVNNVGHAHCGVEGNCSVRDPANPCFHAGWEHDVAIASSRSVETATNLRCRLDVSHFKDSIDSAREASTNRVDNFIDRRQFGASYVDDGYGRRCPR